MNPLDIYQAALNAGSSAVIEGDFARHAATFDLPYLVHTATAHLLVSSVAELRPTFDALRAGLLSRGVTHYERIARTADYVDRNRIEGSHHTHILADGERVAYPYLSRHVLVRRGELWLFSEAHYEQVEAGRWPLSTNDIFDHVKSLAPKVSG